LGGCGTGNFVATGSKADDRRELIFEELEDFSNF
jgi:hypothetical protein